MAYLEIEVKIKVDNIGDIKNHLKKLGFTLRDEEYFESNIIFDTNDNRLKKNGFLLRLRKKNQTSILTFKRSVHKEIGIPDYKIREETESKVSDFESMKKILMALGFNVYFIYEKYREVFQRDNILITVDRTPIGNYIEIEGKQDDIDEVARLLGYKKDHFIVDSYYTLFRKQQKSGFMTFK